MHILLSLDRSLFNYLSAQIESKRGRLIKRREVIYSSLVLQLLTQILSITLLKKKTEHNNYEKKTVPFDDV